MIRFKHILSAVAALALPSVLWAVPADPRPRTITNPDGSEVVVRVHGDERFHFMTDADCTTILQRNEKGFVEKMLRNGQPLAFTTENARMLFEEKQAASPAFMLPEASSSNGMARMATLNSEGRSNYPTIGNGTRSLVVLVEFDDVEFSMENPKEYYTRQLNEEGFSDYGGKGSALDYYKAVSHGLYTPQFDVYGPVKVSKEAAYFEDTQTARMGLLINEAITKLCESGELKLSDYDFDENGILDTVFFYYAGYGSADSDTKTIWPHQSDYQYYTYYGYKTLIFDGVKVGPYACANELKGVNPQTNRQPWKDGSEPWVDGIGTFVHEYGHVLGLPDLYDTEYSGGVVTPGDWDVMAQGCYNLNGCVPPLYSAYEQWVCRWLEFDDAKDATHYDLKTLGAEDASAVRIRIPMTDSGLTFQSEYFVLEARDNSGWDASLPGSGMMVWRINYKKNLWTNNSVNSKYGSNLEIYYADGESQPLFGNGNIYPGGKHELTPKGVYSRWKSPFITDIAFDADTKTVSFDYNVMTEAPSIFPILSDQPFADEGTARNFTLRWDPVDGADAYSVTIKRVSNDKVLGLYDEFEVGNTTSLKVLSVPIAYWNNELQAYVRAIVNGMPSSKTSNPVNFVPKNLPKGDPGLGAVDGIDDDSAVITGGVGCIVAPEGAEVYNMSGAKTAHNNIPAGVYLVSYRGKTAKVIVR